MSDNPAIHRQPSGDVDIDVPERRAKVVEQGETQAVPQPATAPESVDDSEHAACR